MIIGVFGEIRMLHFHVYLFRKERDGNEDI